MSATNEVMSATNEVRSVEVGGQRLRVAIRPGPNEPGPPPRFPLLLINGIGGRLELLEPFVAALDPAVEVIGSIRPASAAPRCRRGRTASPGSSG